MVKFADLQKKSAKKKKKPESSAAKKVTRQVGTALDAHDWYQRACQFLESALGQVRDAEKPDVNEGEHLVEELVQAHSQGDLPQELLIQALHGETNSSFLIANAVNVTVYAILVGSTLGLPDERLGELGLAALLHDVGKILVSEEILYKEETLTEEEFDVIRKYPNESFEVLQSLGEQHHYIAECALQVNERLDGSGYPQGLKDDEIDAYAQIIGILDIYEALTHNRPQRQKFTHFEAVKEILKTQKKAFRREFLKALLDTLSIFPIHSLVKLNSGAIGRVIQTFDDHPMRPRIEIIVDAQKRRVSSPRIIDLREQPILHVVEAVVEEGFAT
jgi:HD-GYP domain-containing protein (c-di-GMP phosphodiesterase class II)